MAGAMLLRGGRVIDPRSGLDARRDLRLEGGRVAELGTRLSARGADVLDVSGLVVCPGFVDAGAYLREPGREDRETLDSGTAAAAAGGYTALVALPDSEPAHDHGGVTRAIAERVAHAGRTRVHAVGALSRGRAGVELAEIGELRAAGCVAISDGDRPVSSAVVMRRALEYARAFGLTVVAHPEDPSLAEGGQMHEGVASARLGLKGVPSAAETVMVERDLQLAELTGGRVHFQQLSAAASVAAVRRAKAAGLPVSAGVSAFHLVLDEQTVAHSGFDAVTKLRPPLRSASDREALVAGLADGTLDTLVAGHAPVTIDEKRCEFDAAEFGASALECAVALALDRLVRAELLPLAALVERLTLGPARAFGLPSGSLAPGAPGDVTVLDLKRERAVQPDSFASLCRATPVAGWKLTGWPVLTIVGGHIAWSGLP